MDALRATKYELGLEHPDCRSKTSLFATWVNSPRIKAACLGQVIKRL